ncbi:MAG: RHS repeat-associated core domain-containing protein [Bacteroidota bacterium]
MSKEKFTSLVISNQKLYWLKRGLFVLLFLSTVLTLAHSQINDGGLASSPSAAGLENQVLSGVSYNTGTPTINIPIFDVIDKDLALPITLAYQASGVKVDQLASWVGLGWNLSAGGAIVREVNSLPDDVHKVIVNNNFRSNAGYLYDSNFSNNIYNKHPNDYTTEEQNHLAQQSKDQSPDIFHFNFGSYKGSFIFGPDGEARMFSENDIKVEYVKTAQTIQPFLPYAGYSVYGAILEFTLTTPDGVQYIFDQPESTFAYTKLRQGLTSTDCEPRFATPYEPEGTNTQMAFSSWRLSKIISPQGEDFAEITLSYEDEFIADQKITNQEHKVYAPDDNTDSAYSPGYNPETTSVLSIILKKRLNRIDWRYGSLEFVAEEDRDDLFYYDLDPSIPFPSQGNALSFIHIKNTAGTTIKTFDFDYSYFPKTNLGCSNLPAWVEAHRERLRLDQVTEKAGNSALPPYAFSYNNTPLPPRHSVQKDHWGFYNGNGEDNLLPSLYAYPSDAQTYYRNMFSIYPRTSYLGNEVLMQGADRSSDYDLMKAGILTSVTYPTGGSLHYEYEPHEFRFNTTRFNYGSDNFKGGGLRVKRITEHDGLSVNNDVVQDFIYEYSNGKSTGELLSMPEFATVFRLGQNAPYVPGNNPNDYTKWHSGRYFISGSHVMYEVVKIDFQGNGKTVYGYDVPASYSYGVLRDEWSPDNQEYIYELPFVETNTDHYSFPYPYEYSLHPYPKFSNYRWNRGQLLFVAQYDESGGVVQQTTYDYAIRNYEKIPTTRAHVNCFGCSEHYIAVGKSNFISAFKYLESKTVSMDGVTTVTDYTVGDNHTLPIATSMENSDGKIHRKEILYPKDAVGVSTKTSQYLIGLMNDRNMIQYPLEEISYVGGLTLGGQKLKYANFSGAILPYQYYEVFADENNSLLRTTLNYYSSGANKGLLSSKQANFFPFAETYTYYTNAAKVGLLKTKQYGQWGHEYDYYDTNRLLKEIKDENNIKSEFRYDDFFRLTGESERNGGIGISYSYHLEQVNGNRNYINVTSSASNLDQNNYFDGLGRPTVSVAKDYSPNMEDVADALTYDNAGRVSQSYLPYRTLGNGGYMPPYGPFETPLYDNSPLNRSTGTMFADGSAAGISYGANAANEEVINYQTGGFYGDGQLYRQEFTDENGNAVVDFKDKIGRLVLTREYLDDAYVDTYNVYDHRNNLLGIMPPDATSIDDILSFRYYYDDRDRVEMQRMPGTANTTIGYNNKDEIESILDGNGNSTIYDYDDYGRLLTQTTNGNLVINNTYDSAPGASLGKLATSAVAILGGANNGSMLNTIYTYDHLGRVLTTTADNHLSNGSDIVTNSYDSGTDRITHYTRRHTGYESIRLVESYDFDHSKRMTDHWFKLDDVPNVRIANLRYDYKDRLIEKNLAYDFSTSDYLQSIDYTYNIRDWLTHINRIHPAGSNLSVESCEALPEQPISDCGDLVVDLEELLRLRLSYGNMDVNCYDPCIDYPQIPVPLPPNSTASSFRTTLNDQITTILNTKQLSDINYPTKLSRVRFKDGREVLMLPEEHTLFPGDYVKEECIDVNSETQSIPVRIKGVTTMRPFGELITLRKTETPEFVLPDVCENDRCTYDESFPAHSVSINRGNSYFSRGPAWYNVLENDNIDNSLAEDGILWNFNGGAEVVWDASFQSQLPSSASNVEYNVTLKGIQNYVKQIHIGLHDGTDFVTINGGNRFLTFNFPGIPDSEFLLEPDSSLSTVQMGNMKVVTMIGGIFSLDAVIVNVKYQALCEIDPPIKPCYTPIPECSEAEQTLQLLSLEPIHVAAQNMTVNDLTLPALLLRVKLCNGSEIYLFQQELAALLGDYIILQPVGISSVDQTFDVDLGLGNSLDNYDLFSLRLYYNEKKDDQGNELSGPGRWNGNISNLQWQTRGRAYQTYGLFYDELDRLNTAQYVEFQTDGTNTSNNQYGVDNITYDLRGNILSLNRNGLMNGCSSPNGPMYGAIDRLSYAYNGNQLQSIKDLGSAVKGFKPGTGDYVHDDNGNMTRDPDKGITIEYNFMNLPKLITFDAGGSIELIYDAQGNKLKKVTTNGTVIDYLGGIEYKNQVLEGIYHSEGRIVYDLTPVGGTGYRYEYTIKDHLGNNRITFADLNDDGKLTIGGQNSEILQEGHYYPFGMNMEGNWVPQIGAKNQYTYAGKELNEDFGLNWLDYGARWYNPSTGRWNGVDPLAEYHDDSSPYNYVGNNPISRVDIDGRDYYESEDGTIIWVDSDADTYVDNNGTVYRNYGEILEITGPDGVILVFKQKQLIAIYDNISEYDGSYLRPDDKYAHGGEPDRVKQDEDFCYIECGDGLIDQISRFGDIVDRDWNAPKNQENVQNLKEVAEILTRRRAPTQMGPGKNLGFGKKSNKSKKKSKKSGKAKGSDIPDWAKGEKPSPGESPNDFAKRLLEGKYGAGNYKTGPGSEYNKLKKYASRLDD